MKHLRVVLGVAAAIVGHPGKRWTREPYFNEFMAKYVTDSGDDDFVAAATKTKCNICHVAGAGKKVRNAFGMELAKLLNKNDLKNPKKIQESLDAVGEQNFDSTKDDSLTWAELFKSGKLP